MSAHTRGEAVHSECATLSGDDVGQNGLPGEGFAPEACVAVSEGACG